MFVTEYLIIVENINCKTVKALKNLIQADDDFVVILKKDKIQYKKNFTFNYEIIKGELATTEKSTYFHLKFSVDGEENIEIFTSALQQIKKVLSIINPKQFTLWDDVSKFYAEKAYSKIFYIENLMRKLLSKFMLVNLGMSWEANRLPDKVKKSIHSGNNDVNFFYNVNFSELSNFLFSESYPTDKLLNKLKKSISKSTIEIEEIKSLIPRSNWDKYFQEVVDCKAEYLRNSWKILNDLRNKIAHNKTFLKEDLTKVVEHTNGIESYLNDALLELEKIIIPKEEIENVAENIVSERSRPIGEFILAWREFESIIEQLFRQLSKGKSISRNIPTAKKLEFFIGEDVISSNSLTELTETLKFRNLVVHGLELEPTEAQIEVQIQKLEKYSQELNKHLTYTEQEHFDKIKNEKILKLYQELKERIFKFPETHLKTNKYYISFISASNVVDVMLQQKAIKLWINLNKGELEDKYGITKDVSKIGHWGNGDYEIHMKPNESIDRVIDLIKQSYKKNSKK